MRLAMITGGGSVVGADIARALVKEGWRIALTDIHLAAAKAVQQDLGEGVEVLALDVRDLDAVHGCAAKLLDCHGRIDALVNCAGSISGLGLRRKPFIETTPDEWELIIQTNFNGVLNCATAVLPSMIERGFGVIVSLAAGRGEEVTLYAAAKAATVVFTQSLAQEVGPYGIRVNTVAPGNAEARGTAGSAAEAVTLPGRPTSATDLGAAIAFLISERASHITGSCLRISGGVPFPSNGATTEASGGGPL